MTKRSDIIDPSEIYRPNGSIVDRGLIYTTECGWIDLGHANPEGRGFEGARSLWDQVKTKTSYFQSFQDKTPATVVYMQTMRRFGAGTGIVRRYKIKRELPSAEEQKSIALAIFMDVSLAFEELQANWFFRHITDSGYSVEDLISNLIGFYRAVNPGTDYIKSCNPVSKQQALATWDTYGPVGSMKNRNFTPILYPNPLKVCGIAQYGRLPQWLDTIKPAMIGVSFEEIR
jgi:hypothetical protein